MMNFAKRIFSVTLAFIMVLLLTACSNGKGSASNSESANSENASNKTNEPVKIEFWYSWTDKIQENNINLTKKFNETIGKEKGIEVTAVYQGTYDDVHQKLQAAHVADNPPAVSVMEIASTKLFAENKIIVPLKDYIERDGVDINDFYEGLLQNCKVDEIYYGLPYLRSTPILYLNKTLLEKAGLDPTGPKTWDELENYCKTVNEKLGIYGLSMHSYIWTMESFFLQQGSSALASDELTTNINTEAGKAVFSYFKNLIDKGYIRMLAGEDSSKVSADVMNQNTAMWFSSTGDLTKNLAIAEENGFEVGTAYIPKAKEYGVPTGGCNLVISHNISDEEKEAAWEFVKWMTETEQTVYASGYTGYVPTRKSAVKTDEIKKRFETTPQTKVALDQLQECGHGRPMNPHYSEASKEFVNVMDAIWVNGADVDSALADAETKINKILQQ